jgi:hypothetical protein
VTRERQRAAATLTLHIQGDDESSFEFDNSGTFFMMSGFARRPATIASQFI